MNISDLPCCDTRIKPVLVAGRFNLTLSLSRRLLSVVWFWLKRVSAGRKPPASLLPWMLSWLTVIAAHFAKGHKRLYYTHVSLHGNVRLHLTTPTAHPSAQKPGRKNALFHLTDTLGRSCMRCEKSQSRLHLSAGGRLDHLHIHTCDKSIR